MDFTRKKQELTLSAVILLVSFPMFLIEWNGVGGSVYIQLLGFLLTALYTFELARAYPAYMFSAFYQIYSFMGLVVSGILISTGAYMLEVERAGTPNGAVWVCIIFYVLGLKAGLLGYRQVRLGGSNVPKLPDNIAMVLFLALAVSILSAAAIIFITLKGPIVLGVDRVTFWQTIAPDYLSRFPSIFGQSFIFAALLFFSYRKRGWSQFVPVSIILFYVLFTVIVSGEKFSTFIIYLTMWFFVAAGYGVKVKLSFRVISIGVLIAAALVALIVTQYVYAGRGPEFIFDRAALQGQLVWSVMNDGGFDLLRGLGWLCYFGCDSLSSGTDFISARYMPPNLFASYQASGSGLTGYMPSLAVVSFGLPVALVLHVGFSYGVGCIQKNAVNSVRAENFLAAVILFKIYFALLIFWYAADTYVIRGMLLSACILLLLSSFPTKSRSEGSGNREAHQDG